MKPKIVIFTIADNKNLKWAKGLENSLRRFHGEKEVDFKIYGQDYIDKALKEDHHFFYKGTPWVARELMDEYETVVKMDADSLVTGKLDHIFNSEYEVGVVNNFNVVDSRTFGRIGIFDIRPEDYFNCGLVAMRSKKFVNHWFKLCQSEHFQNYRMREQDLLNIICWYGDYRIRRFDDDKTFNGLASKDFWAGSELEDGKLWVKFVDGNNKEIARKQICVLHWAEGNNSNKMLFDVKFIPEVSSYLKELANYG